MCAVIKPILIETLKCCIFKGTANVFFSSDPRFTMVPFKHELSNNEKDILVFLSKILLISLLTIETHIGI